MRRGQLVVVDSPEGAGKTTLLNVLKKRVSDQGKDEQFVFTREPGGTPYAEEIRALILGDMGKQADAKTLLALFWAARADHIKNLVKPALEAGKHVISDRFDSATFAYQIWGYENHDLIPTFSHMREVYMKGIVPFYIFLDVPIEVGLARKSNTSEKNFLDEKSKEFHKLVYRGFGEFFAMVPNMSRRVDASQSPDKVADDVIKLLNIVLVGGTPPRE